MSVTAFDALDFYNKLVAAGMEKEQANLVADAFRRQEDSLDSQLVDYANKQDKRASETLASKQDIAELKYEIAKMDTRIARTEVRLIKWVLGVGVSAFFALFGALGGMMAKGFGWW